MLETFGDAPANFCLPPDGGLEIGHQHGRRHPFSGGVAETKARWPSCASMKSKCPPPTWLAGTAPGDVIAGDLSGSLEREIDLQFKGPTAAPPASAAGPVPLRTTGCFDHLRRLGADDTQQPLVVVGKTVVRFLVEERQQADHLAFRQQGHPQQRPDGEFLVAGHQKARPAAILHQQRPVVFEHPAGQLFVQPIEALRCRCRPCGPWCGRGCHPVLVQK